jgi:CBS domain-containing protein
MTANPVCCTASDTLRYAAQLLRDNDCGSLPVVDSQETKRLVGIVTDRDMVCRVLAADADCNTATVGSAMSTGQLWTANADAAIDDVIEMMEDGQVRRIPVLDEEKCVIGIIATADLALELDEVEDVAEVFEEISEPTHLNR